MWLIPNFMMGNAKQDLLTRLETDDTKGKPNSRRYGWIVTYDEVVNYLLTSCATEQNILRANAENTRLTQRIDQLPANFVSYIFNRSRSCGLVYDKHDIFHNFIEGINEKIYNLTRRHFRSNPTTTFENLPWYARDIDHKSDGSRYIDNDREWTPRSQRQRQDNAQSSEQSGGCRGYITTSLYAIPDDNRFRPNENVPSSPPDNRSAGLRGNKRRRDTFNDPPDDGKTSYSQLIDNRPAWVTARDRTSSGGLRPDDTQRFDSSMDTGPIWCFCFAPSSEQVNSQCQLIQNNRDDIIALRNKNYRRVLQAGLLQKYRSSRSRSNQTQPPTPKFIFIVSILALRYFRMD